MRFSLDRRFGSLAVALVAAALAACSGNLGSGSVGGGLPAAPGAPGYQQPGGPGASTTSTSRQKVTEGAVFATPGIQTIPLPTVGGFSLVLNVTSPEPSAAPSPLGSASPQPGKTGPPHASLQKTARVVVVAQAAAPAASPSAAVSPGAPAAGGGPATASAAPAPSPTASGVAKRTAPSPTPSPGKIDTKLVIYPDYEPDAPTPVPTGNVVTYNKRHPIVSGYVSPAMDVSLYGLASARFTIPAEEQIPARGFTIAIFTSAKKHKEQLVAADTAASLDDNVVASALTTPITLKKGTGYDIVLYGDDLPSTPAPVPSSYPTPGNNPFVTPTPAGYPQAPGQPYATYPPPGGATYPPPGATYPPPGATYPPQGPATFTPFPH